jgi:CHAT domain-containing protein
MVIHMKGFGENDDQLPHITWCPSGPLTFLPLHAAGDYGKPNENIMARAVSSYTPSTEALLKKQPKNPGTNYSLLVVCQSNAPGASRLPGTEKETELIRSRFPTGVTLLEGERGTVSAVLDAMANHSWVHLACHGIQHPENPTKSAFILHDGKLELAQLMSKSFTHADLAVLSACQTATGEQTLSEEVVHLAAGMLNVGYKSVVGTMWSIGDSDAPVVSDAFYARIREDCEKGLPLKSAYALHEATKILREKVGITSFVQWVPFVHFGI